MKTALNKIILSVAVTVVWSFTADAASNNTPAPARAVAEVSVAAKPKFTYATIKAIENFSQRRLTDRDYESVKNVVQTLALLDEQDPSRTAVMMLSESYGKYQKIYDRAFKTLITPQNKSQLNEIRELMIHFNKDGNG